jgi:MFS family permease
VTPTLRRQFFAAAGIFLANGIMIGAWVARIPAIATQTNLDARGVGFALVGSTIGAVLTMPIGGWLGGKFGSHVTAAGSTFLCGVALYLISLSSDFASLAAALFLFGIAQGTMDVSMNANGIAVERAGAGPVISRLHAMWSVGAFLGALFSTQCAALGIGVTPEFAAIAVAMTLAALAMTQTLIHDRHTGEGPLFRLPSGRLLLIGGLCAAGLLAETSATDWSGLYLHDDMGLDLGLAGLGVTVFTGCMAISRLVGDRLTVAIGTARLVSGGSAMAAIGLLLVVGPKTLPLAIVGFALIGLGLAGVVPSFFRAGGTQPGIPSAVGVAAVSTMGYAGGMIGPPIIGTLGAAFSLRFSLLILLGLMILLVILSPRALAGVPAAEPAVGEASGRTAES